MVTHAPLMPCSLATMSFFCATYGVRAGAQSHRAADSAAAVSRDRGHDV